MSDLHVVVTRVADHASAWKDYGVPFSTAVLGALLAYVPSRLLAGRASRELLQRDEKARREVELLAARRVFIKLSVLVNAILGYHEQVEAMVSTADRNGNGHMTIAQRLSAFAGIEREQTLWFEADELEVFIAAKRPDYVDDLVLLARRHAAVLSSLEAFGRMKTELHYELAKHGYTSRDVDEISTTVARLPVNLGNYFRVKAGELDLFAQSMRELLGEIAVFARRVAADYEPIARAHLGDTGAVGLHQPS